MLVEYSELSNTKLVEMAMDGDELAFSRLYEIYRNLVFLVALNIVNNYDDAEDLTQDVFIQAQERLWQLSAPQAFGGWLRQISFRMSINSLRKKKRGPRFNAGKLEQAQSHEEAPDVLLETSETRQQVRRIVDGLSEIQRTTLLAFYFEGRMIHEIADDFKIPEGTVKRRLYSGRKKVEATYAS